MAICRLIDGQQLIWNISCSAQIPNKQYKPTRKFQTARSRRIVLTSSSEDSDEDTPLRTQKPEVIEISDSSPERSPKKTTNEKTTTNEGLPLLRPSAKQPSSGAPERILPLYADDDVDQPWNVDDGSILTL